MGSFGEISVAQIIAQRTAGNCGGTLNVKRFFRFWKLTRLYELMMGVLRLGIMSFGKYA